MAKTAVQLLEELKSNDLMTIVCTYKNRNQNNSHPFRSSCQINAPMRPPDDQDGYTNPKSYLFRPIANIDHKIVGNIVKPKTNITAGEKSNYGRSKCSAREPRMPPITPAATVIPISSQLGSSVNSQAAFSPR